MYCRGSLPPTWWVGHNITGLWITKGYPLRACVHASHPGTVSGSAEGPRDCRSDQGTACSAPQATRGHRRVVPPLPGLHPGNPGMLEMVLFLNTARTESVTRHYKPNSVMTYLTTQARTLQGD